MSVARKILNRIDGYGYGAAFTAKDLLDLGSRAAVDQTLSRLARTGRIRRVARGVYDIPRQSTRLGALAPAPEQVAQAVARKSNSRIQASDAQAANRLGLTTQVPAKPVYLTDGPTRRIQTDGQLITLRHAAPRTFAAAGRPSGLVFQALRHLGRAHVDDAVIQRLRARLSDADKQTLRRDAGLAPGWMTPIVARIVMA